MGGDDASRLKIWTDGASKGNHISGIGRIGGVGVVFDHPSLPKLYGPVEFNLTEKVTNNAAELQAAILGLEQAKERGFNIVEINTDSQFLKNIMTDWLDKWKAKNWRKSDGKPVKISVDLVKKLDVLRFEMDIEWKWLPRNSCPEMILADALANHGCEVYLWHQPQELEGNKLFRRTMYDRRLSYPDDLPPTVLRTKDQVLISSSKTVKICCTLDISERLKQKLIENKTQIMTMASDQAYGYVMCMRTMDKLSKDSTVMAKYHTFGSENIGNKDVRPTLVLPRGSIVGIGFSGAYGHNDDQADKSLMGMLFFTDINEN